jgi:hypothetical protein
LSERAVEQEEQLAPAEPHAATVGLWHCSPWQQPLGQLVASQTQAPPTQR